MNIISKILSNKRSNNSCALIPFIIAGYPSIDTTIQILHLLDNKGVDIIELGIPYSDALADGPIIQNASKVALNQGVYIDQVLSILKQTTYALKASVVIFSYYNPVLVRGVEKFINEISSLGAKGLIIPDLPMEETNYLISLCTYYKIELILFIAPTSSKARINKILSKAPGCLYIVSRTGVTGIKSSVNFNLSILFQHIKLTTNKLIMLGFGISSAKQASTICKWDIDAIVIGTAFIQLLSDDNCDTNINRLDKFGIFFDDIKASIKV
uniref:Tryptophan synthase alpha chain n=1 Tax=Caloglossa beccarii TaxID=131038 RepID=A0A1Z1M811_9FLOR|nr:Tryptophan synthase alpha subunit [Caloglossa beccarii]ARW62228.1 Tryptophan synthase alpha subunit [Caloglossa beccarii]